MQDVSRVHVEGKDVKRRADVDNWSVAENLGKDARRFSNQSATAAPILDTRLHAIPKPRGTMPST